MHQPFRLRPTKPSEALNGLTDLEKWGMLKCSFKTLGAQTSAQPHPLIRK